MKVKELGLKESSDERYREWLKECFEYAKISKHPTTHNAALLIKDGNVILRGANILPSGVKDKPERYEGEKRHLYPNHAERDLVYRAAKEGIKTDGLTMVMPWIPCINCANAVISSGIKKLIVHKMMVENTREGWQQELKNAIEILKEASVEIIAYDGFVGSKVYMNRGGHEF
jgi:dCMP deaminase